MGSSLSGRPETLATAAGAPSEANPPATSAPVSPAFPAAAPLASPATPASRPPASPPASPATAPLASPAPPASPTTPVSRPLVSQAAPAAALPASPPVPAAAPSASPAQDRIFKNCWSCRVLSGSALFAAGAYVYLVARKPMKLGYSPSPGTIAQMVFGIGIASWGIVVLTDPKGKAYRV